MVLFHFILFFWLIFSWISFKGNAEKRSYMTYDMGIICRTHPSFKIRMHHSGTGSTGILKASDYLEENEEKECVAVIRPPRGYGVVFNIEDVHLRRDANFDCRDYLKIYNETSRSNVTAPMCRDCCHFSRTRQVCAGRCGYESDGMVCDEFCDKNNASHFATAGTGRSIAIHYHTRCGGCTERKEEVGFRMVFTAFRLLSAQEAPCVWPSDFQCDNGRCIWSGLKCDGHNNCGDLSDENLTGKSQCGGFPDPVKAAIVASAVIVTVLFLIVLAYFPKMSFRAFLGQKRKTTSMRLAQHRQAMKKKNGDPNFMMAKPGSSRSSSYQVRLPQIKEIPHTESEV